MMMHAMWEASEVKMYGLCLALIYTDTLQHEYTYNAQ